ncbi:MAG: hypothetical protein JWN43_1926 [Gammaproteobacteria bacterium]|nr:hypothetical protein [Gammaproteobacteria bacterium]
MRVMGRGAGRWSTTEAVIADLLDAHREQRREAPVIDSTEVPANRESVGPPCPNAAHGGNLAPIPISGHR